MDNLSSKKCVPCEAGVPPMTEELAKKYLLEVPGWVLLNGKKIKREFVFNDFTEAIRFINRVAEIAESEGHHPDIHLFNYNRVEIALSTHAIKGLSENDFILASKINTLAQ